MKDRVPLYPGRVKLTPVSGQANTYDMVRADSPTQEGTPLNKASLLKDATAALYGLGTDAVPDDLLSVLSKSVLAHVTAKYTKHTISFSDFSPGDTVQIPMDGGFVEFLALHKGLPSSLYDNSCNGLWLLMNDVRNTIQWKSSGSNNYESSTIDSYLNSTFLNRFDSNMQNAIKEVKIPYYSGSGNTGTNKNGADGLSCKAFLLSMQEVGLDDAISYIPDNGAKLDYFENGTGTAANAKRIANRAGAAISWWLRSIRTNRTDTAAYIGEDGTVNSGTITNSLGVRPCIILPSDGECVYYTDADGNIYSEQEVETQLTDVLGNLIQIPASQIKDGVKLETGSYTGTGTYGASNPNSLTFTFNPLLVLLFCPTEQNYQAMSLPNISTTVYPIPTTVAVGMRWEGSTLLWWCGRNDPAPQFNSSGNKYYYLALG